LAARIEWTPAALSDLDDIWLHIARDSRNAANRFLDRVDSAEERLADNPLIGVARDDLAPGMRLWPIGNHVFLYRFEPGLLTIVRLVWGGRSLGALINQ